MEPSSKAFLRRLLSVPGPSGYEQGVQKVWREYVTEFCPDIRTDVHNNVVATLLGTDAFSVMVVGHADEIGLAVIHIDDQGYIYFNRIGGVDASILPSQRVWVLAKTGPIRGVIGKKPKHLLDEDDQKPPKIHDLWIDIGAKDRADAQRQVRVGDPIVFGEDFEEMQNGFAVARNFDNRVGCYVAAETLRALTTVSGLKPTVFGVSSAQEETGVWGAGPIAYALKPSLGIAIDVTHGTDYPGLSKNRFGDVQLGKGPVITRGVKTSERVYELLEQTALAHAIPCQIEVEVGRTGTDADVMADRGAGIAVTVVSIPNRYMHTSTEVIHLDDLDHCVNLLAAFIQTLDGSTDLIPS
ncbi:MAG: M42 family metallopeptidase [Chloroflexi bacterium]|nr:M42 family metallopeptidase [Chloroflexota bacterium]